MASAATGAAGADASANGAAGDGTGTGTASGDPKSVSDALNAALATLRGGAATLNTHVASAAQGAASTGSSIASSFAAHMGTQAKVKTLGTGIDDKSAADGTSKSVAATAADTGAQNANAALAAAATATQQAASTQTAASSSATDTLAATQAAAAAAAQAQATQATQSASANPAAAAAASTALAPQVGTSDWEDALSQKVVFLSNAHQQSAELTLNPKDLGPLQVVLQVADNHAHALFVSQHQQVREAVEAALPKLREQMQENGIGLGSASVSDGFSRQMNQQAQQDSGSGAGGSRTSRSGGAAGVGPAGGADSAASAATTATQRSVGLIDTFA
ncbi:flagellar hook-length control protein FliK [Paraburkholderia silviterrae]|uniref:flagellar hook-length control protein FliK n=1 Tax=Paraburkholderia silviterrae TaxID=2528715 RepID=UPI00362B80F3